MPVCWTRPEAHDPCAPVRPCPPLDCLVSRCFWWPICPMRMMPVMRWSTEVAAAMPAVCLTVQLQVQSTSTLLVQFRLIRLSYLPRAHFA